MPSRMNAILCKISRAVTGNTRYIFLCLLSALVLSGCGTFPNGHRWGQDAFYPIDIDRVSRAAHDAFFINHVGHYLLFPFNKFFGALGTVQ